MLEHLILCLIIVIVKSLRPPETFSSGLRAHWRVTHGGTNYSRGPRYENSNDNIKSVDMKNEHSQVWGLDGAEFNYQIMLSNSDR